MNPFFMQNFFTRTLGLGCGMIFNPMSIGLMSNPFCCSNFMTMPNYNELSFLNNPIIRNTSMDFLLDPRLSFMQCQQQWAQGGGWGGSTALPGWSFPGNSPFPIAPWAPQQKTEEQKKAEEKKKEEEKKPEAEKAKKLNNLFKEIKKICADEDNLLDPISNDLSKKAEEAMKKETAKERYDGMKEVMEEIDSSVIRKAVLANSTVRENLRRAGYNFNNRTYSIKNPDIKDGNFDNKKKVEELHRDIKEYKLHRYNALQALGADVTEGNANRKYVLSFVSAWNDTYHDNGERGILRFIASNMPKKGELEEISFKETLPVNVESITRALLAKATEYEGNEKVESLAKNVSEQLDKIMKEHGTGDAKTRKDFTEANIKTLADHFDKLYVELRMQEAVKVRDSINKNDDFKVLSELDDSIIDENIVVEETIKDLKAEGFSDSEIPEAAKLTKTKKSKDLKDKDDLDNKKADKKFEGKPQEKLNYLVEKEYLTKVSDDSDVYTTRSLDGKGKFARFYQIVDDTLVEVVKNDKGEFKPIGKELEEVNIEDIANYHDSIERASSLISSKAIEDYSETVPHSKYPVFKATGANEFYIIKDNQLCLIKSCTGIEESEEDDKYKVTATGTQKTLDELTTENFLNPDFKDEDIKSKAKVDAAKKEKETADIKKVTDKTFTSLKEAKSYKSLKELSQLVTDSKSDSAFKALKVNGYFSSVFNGKTRYYRYDENSNKLIYLSNVKEIKNGYAVLHKGGAIECREVIIDEPLNENETMEQKIQDYGYKFAKDVSGNNTPEQELDAVRKLNTLVGMLNKDCSMAPEDKALFTINFIKGYQKNTHWYTAQSKGICRQILGETEAIATGNNIHILNSARRYIARIAQLMLIVAETTNYGDTDKCETLEKIADGSYRTNMPGHNIGLWPLTDSAIALDTIIGDILKEYDKNNS